MAARGTALGSGIGRAVVIKGDGRLPAEAIQAITDRDVLVKVAAKRGIVFHPSTSVERMKRRLIEG